MFFEAMTTVKELVARERPQFLLIAGLAVATAGIAAALNAGDPQVFTRFLGPINPVIAFVVVNAGGVALLALLLARGWFAIYRQGQNAARLGAAGLAVLLAAITVLLDLKIVFPRDLNVAFPLSLPFYPAIGFLVEILFHVLPLAVLLPVLTARPVALAPARAAWIAIVIVSLLEPAFQVTPMLASGSSPLWASVFLAVHLTLFNLLQLITFKRYDFVAMYGARLAYYAVWHVAWGALRLRVLF